MLIQWCPTDERISLKAWRLLMSLQGISLITELQENSGLDKDFFNHQINHLLGKYSVDPNHLNIDQLRDVLSDYLQALILTEESDTQ